MSRKIDDSQRGITNRGLGQQGIVPIALGPTRRSGARAPAPAPAPAKGQPRAPTSNRTIYVVKDEVFMNIPNDVRKAALDNEVRAEAPDEFLHDDNVAGKLNDGDAEPGMLVHQAVGGAQLEPQARDEFEAPRRVEIDRGRLARGSQRQFGPGVGYEGLIVHRAVIGW